jgi:hypothetical protein
LAILPFAVAILIPTTSGHQDGGNLVNAVLGNASGFELMGETERIRAHLEGVANRLSRADNSSLDEAERYARTRNIERLREYARAEQFPSKPASIPGRIPNFLDVRGNVCAVGFLVEQDLGRDAVVAIAREHQFDYVPYIDAPVLAQWQAASGLSKQELAMIQPSYGDGGMGRIESPGYVSDETALSIGLITLNVVTSLVNFSHLSESNGDVITGFIGTLGGALTFVLAPSNTAAHASAAMAGAFGLVSFGWGAVASDNPRNVSVSAVAIPNDGDKPALGMMASVRF